MANLLQLAQTMIGTHEGQAALSDYLKTGGANLDPETTAWCAAFVNSTLQQSGMEGTGSNMARSFLNWGEQVATPQAGDIGVWPRGDPKGPYGHVGIVQSYDPKTGQVMLVSGNQSDAVTAHPYMMEKALGFRRASEARGAGGAAVVPAGATGASGGPRGGPVEAAGGGAGNEAAGPQVAPMYEAPATDDAPAATPLVLPEKKKTHWLEDFAKNMKGVSMGGPGVQMSRAVHPGASVVDAPQPQVPVMPVGGMDPARREQLAMIMQRLNSGRLFV